MLRAMLSISAATVLSRATGYARWMAQAAVLGTTRSRRIHGLHNPAQPRLRALPGWHSVLDLYPGAGGPHDDHGEEDARRLTNALHTRAACDGGTGAGRHRLRRALRDALHGLGAAKDSPAEAERTVDLAVFFFRIFAVQMLFYGVSTIATGVLQSPRRFFLPTFAPVLNNLMVIASFAPYAVLVGVDPTLALYVLAGGVTVGTAIMALALVPTMWNLGYRPRPQLGHPALVPTAKLAGPMVVLVAGLGRLPGVRRLPRHPVPGRGAAQLRLRRVLASLRRPRRRYRHGPHARALRGTPAGTTKATATPSPSGSGQWSSSSSLQRSA